MDICLYIVPYDSARRGERMGAGPMYLMDSGLEAFLRDRGHSLLVKTVEAAGDFPTEVGTSFDLYRRLAAQIQADCSGGAFPLVLAGNCGAALGSIAGLSALFPGDLAAAWFDAHGDFNTPDTTLSGYLDGMCLATAAGLGWKQLARTLPGFRPLSPRKILHVGGRDFDAGEQTLLAQHAVNLAGAEAVHQTGVPEALRRFAQQANHTPLYLHFDVDVLDPAETPANHFPAPGGLFPGQVAQAFRLLRQKFLIRGLTVASFDPRFDETGSTRAAIFALIDAALSDA